MKPMSVTAPLAVVVFIFAKPMKRPCGMRNRDIVLPDLFQTIQSYLQQSLDSQTRHGYAGIVPPNYKKKRGGSGSRKMRLIMLWKI
jgi:hypothetical protein